MKASEYKALIKKQELGGLILKLRTRCKAMRNTYPVEYGKEILMYQSIIKHLIELQKYRISMDEYCFGSIEEMQNELLQLRRENESLRDKILYLESELRECYEHIRIDKRDYSYDDWLENDYNDDELDDYIYDS